MGKFRQDLERVAIHSSRIHEEEPDVYVLLSDARDVIDDIEAHFSQLKDDFENKIEDVITSVLKEMEELSKKLY